jgi:tagatose-6-phosphate ketose/aldose isomerase
MAMFGLSEAQLEKAGAKWTAREILQQPEVWAEVEKLIADQAARLNDFLQPILKRSDLRIVLTGAGTSAHIGACLAPALTRTLGRRIDAIPTTDLVASPQSYLLPQTPTLLVSFGRSGNSPESVAAVDVTNALCNECFHLAFTCDVEGALYKQARSSPKSYAVALPEKSNDRSFAMTSSFTGMLLAGALAFRALPTNSARISALTDLANQVRDGLPLLQALVAREFDRVVHLGSREFQGLTRECALKMLEMTDGKVVALADTPLGFRHGPKTILNRNTLVVVYVCNDAYTRQYDLDLVNELRRDAVAGRVIAMHAGPPVESHMDNIVLRPGRGAEDLSDLELCLPYAMFAQSLAMLRSLWAGVSPDNPNKAGTVSRVVKGVSIHPWRRTV